jgi:hypothetical protein
MLLKGFAKQSFYLAVYIKNIQTRDCQKHRDIITLAIIALK